ncbi:tRNA 2-selenouridine synthase [Campylobacter concisus]|uniref:tRNA 2-selenouridine synthase n=1 Tax=Campylobacter concisus TaxID=199 RepID=UPI000CD9A37B|nr:tRNA 2-selenouridine synthase [Campylobacter concisus]
MKFIGIILLLLTSIFLIACSANQASNKISNSELENLASKYGGVYVFDEKFEKEITTKEKIRREAELAIVNASKTDAEMRKNLKGFDTKYPQTLSNGKKYYTRWMDYERETGKKAEIPETYINKIKEFIGDDFLKEEPRIYPKYMYFDGKEMSVIKIYLSYDYIKTKYGLFGDENRGISFKQDTFGVKSGDNIFYLINGKFERVSKDK